MKQNIIFITSFSPAADAANRQAKALASWIRLGVPILSLNVAGEIERLRAAYLGMEFAPTTETTESVFGEVMRGGKDILRNAKYIYTEYSDEELYSGQVSMDGILELLPDFRVVAYNRGSNDNVLLEHR